MSYVVLARKWRPAQFSDIVGQSHIVRTLNNAIRSQRIHQAYLFTGSRGIGKTSIARIFAKVLRCPNVVDDATLGLRSCDQCPSCLEIARGSGVDVLEMDGASNNGVDAIREIRENAQYMPSTGTRKIIIIDEVHMLTTAAFNALLKTLEEPPAHVVFIFATTEPHKIPATILSRVQRFDYRRVTVPQIQARLTEVLGSEGIEAEAGALTLIARAADGSMRDSLSLLDQVIAFSGQKITVQAVRESIGLVGGEFLLELVHALFARDSKKAVALVGTADAQGHDLRVVARGLLELLHAAALLKIQASVEAMELSEEEIQTLRTATELRTLEEIELIFQVIHYGIETMARSPQPRLVLDLLLIKCAEAEALVSVDQATPLTTAATTVTKAAVISPAPVTPAPQASRFAGFGAAVTSAPNGPTLAQAPAAAPAAKPAPTPAPIAAANPFAAAPAPRPAAAPAVAATPPAGEEIIFHAPQLPPHLAEAKAMLSTGPAANPSWEGLIALVKTRRPLLASILEHGSLEQLPTPGSDPTLLLVFSPETSYYKEQLQVRIYADQLAALGREYFGIPQLRIQLETREGAQESSVAAKRENQAREQERIARDAAANHPMIREAQALFGAEVGQIEVLHGNA